MSDRQVRSGLNVPGSILLCLTSLRHRRYVEDVINIVGLPNGAHIRLRYSRAYVSSSVWDSVASDTLPNARVLIALGASPDPSSSKVAPLRTARIVGAKCQGQLLVLDVALSDFAYEILPLGHFWLEAQSKASGLPQHFHSAQRGPGNYVELIQGPITTVVTGATVSAWEEVAQRVLAQDDLLNGEATRIPFLYFMTGLSTRMQRDLDGNGAITIDSGANLQFDVHSVTRKEVRILRNPLGEVILDMSHAAATFVTSRRLRVDSSRDVKRLKLSTTTLFRRAHGHLSLRLIEFMEPNGATGADEALDGLTPGADRAETVVARYDFPLVVGRWRPMVASLGLAVSSALLAWDAPGASESIESSLLVPAIVGVLAFFALALGFWKEGGR